MTPFQEQQSVLGVQEGVGAEPKRVSKEDFWSSRHWADVGYEKKNKKMEKSRETWKREEGGNGDLIGGGN